MKKCLSCIAFGFGILVDLAFIPIRALAMIWAIIHKLWSEFMIDQCYKVDKECGEVFEKDLIEASQVFCKVLLPRKRILPTEES